MLLVLVLITSLDEVAPTVALVADTSRESVQSMVMKRNMLVKSCRELINEELAEGISEIESRSRRGDDYDYEIIGGGVVIPLEEKMMLARRILVMRKMIPATNSNTIQELMICCKIYIITAFVFLVFNRTSIIRTYCKHHRPATFIFILRNCSSMHNSFNHNPIPLLKNRQHFVTQQQIRQEIQEWNIQKRPKDELLKVTEC